MNKYHVLGIVGEGTYGVVLKCQHKDTSDFVAIKRFKETDQDATFRKVTLREVSILKAMRHDNIVQLKEAFRRKGTLCLVFEFVEKSMLDVLTDNPNGVCTELARVLTHQLANALEYCHRHDVLHRDIKPENLLIDPVDNRLKLCDFGFARRLVGDAEPLTDYVATRWYRAPELLVGSAYYGTSVDVWSLGCIMGELCDGQPLFPGESDVDQLFVIQKVLGPLTTTHLETFVKNPRFSGMHFRDVKNPETLDQRYNNQMSQSQLHVLKSVLAMDPRQRLAARDIMNLPWFEGVTLPRSSQPLKLPLQNSSSRSPEPSNSTRETGGQGLSKTACALDSESAGESSRSPLGSRAPWLRGDFFPERARAGEETPRHPLSEDPSLTLSGVSPTRPEKPSVIAEDVVAFRAGPHALGKTLIIFGRPVGDREPREESRDGDASGRDEPRDKSSLRGARRRRATRRSTVHDTRSSLQGASARFACYDSSERGEGRLPSILASREHAPHGWANPGVSTPRDKYSVLPLPSRSMQINPAWTPRLEGVPEIRNNIISQREGCRKANRGQ